jgi:hypothetical protein
VRHESVPFSLIAYFHSSQSFPGHGTFEGRITAFDGEHYRVYYSADEDEEQLSEYEFGDLKITFTPEATDRKRRSREEKARKRAKARGDSDNESSTSWNDDEDASSWSSSDDDAASEDSKPRAVTKGKSKKAPKVSNRTPPKYAIGTRFQKVRS